jgi:protein FRA10AC1
LFKEYCICDLSQWEEKKIAMRWRIDKEVVSGKGQFICSEKRCEEKEHLRSWEVLFAYVEHGKKRDALVKLSKLFFNGKTWFNSFNKKRIVSIMHEKTSFWS